MHYAILCYHDERIVTSWTKEEDDVVIGKLAVVQQKLAAQGKLGPVVRLLPTTSATTLRKDRQPPLITDGPFAETKEQLLGFYIVDCASRDEAHDAARELAAANPGGLYEIRPLSILNLNLKEDATAAVSGATGAARGASGRAEGGGV